MENKGTPNFEVIICAVLAIEDEVRCVVGYGGGGALIQQVRGSVERFDPEGGEGGGERGGGGFVGCHWWCESYAEPFRFVVRYKGKKGVGWSHGERESLGRKW